MDTSKQGSTRQLSVAAKQVPKEYNFTTAEPKGHKGLCLHREDELGHIHGYFMKRWEPKKYGTLLSNDPMAYLITNAPGAGKTTVREEAARRFMDEGVTVIELDPEDLADDKRLVEGLLEHATATEAELSPSEQKSFISNLYGQAITAPGRGPVMTGIATGAMMLANMPGLLVTAGATVTAVAAEILRSNRAKTMEAVEAKWPTTPKQALKLLSQTHQGRFLVTVD